jgi:ribosome-associated heat shock protein Hsp15
LSSSSRKVGPTRKLDLPAAPKLRLDKYLFQARFFRNRDAAAEVITEGHLRLNGQHCLKPGHGVGPGDVLTFVQADRIRVIRILALAQRRGPAEQAQALYLDLDAPQTASSALE